MAEVDSDSIDGSTSEIESSGMLQTLITMKQNSHNSL